MKITPCQTSSSTRSRSKTADVDWPVVSGAPLKIKLTDNDIRSPFSLVSRLTLQHLSHETKRLSGAGGGRVLLVRRAHPGPRF